MKRLALPLSLIALFGASALAQTCPSYSATDIANAISNSSTASSALESSPCTWGGAGKSEFGSNTCAPKGANFGVPQLSTYNVQQAGYAPQQYQALPLQQQVEVWASQVGNANASSGNVSMISNAAVSGQSIGGTPATSGMAAACVQFGSLICKNDLAALQAGQPCGGANPVVVTAGKTGSLTNGTATEEGNGQSICSWGTSIQNSINSCTAASCAPTYNNVTGGGAMPGSTPTTAPTINTAPGLITAS